MSLKEKLWEIFKETQRKDFKKGGTKEKRLKEFFKDSVIQVLEDYGYIHRDQAQEVVADNPPPRNEGYL